METKRTEAVPFPAQGTGEIADLSNELEQQLNQQLESLDYGSEFSGQNFSRTEEDFSRDSQGLSGTRPFITEGEEGGEHRESAPEKPSGKTASLINESKFLRYIADLRKADSESVSYTHLRAHETLSWLSRKQNLRSWCIRLTISGNTIRNTNRKSPG